MQSRFRCIFFSTDKFEASRPDCFYTFSPIFSNGCNSKGKFNRNENALCTTYAQAILHCALYLNDEFENLTILRSEPSVIDWFDWFQVCQASFVNRQSLLDHRTIHTEEFPYQCERYPSTFVFLYTGSRLQRVRVLRAPVCNEKIFPRKKNTSDWHQCLNKVWFKYVLLRTSNF